jgi:hypothetical protein
LRSAWRPWAHELRHRREVAPDEHEVGDALGDLRPAALRDRQPRGLQRRHVVDAVADHRDVTAGIAQRLDDAALVIRRYAADDRRREHPLAQRVRVVGKVGALRRAAHRDADVGGDGGDRLGVVARQDLDLDVLLEEEGDRLADVRAQPLGEDDEPDRVRAAQATA